MKTVPVKTETTMKLNTIVLLAQCLLFSLTFYQSSAQDIYYYGPDTNYHYQPSDIIETQGGELLIVAAVNYRISVPQNDYFNRYLVKIRPNGDTVWTRSHPHTRTKASLLEKADGSLMVWSDVHGSQICNGVFSSYPYADQSIYTYTANGMITNTVSYDEGCDESFIGTKKRDDGGILTTHSDNFGSYQINSIKELSPTGQRTSLPYPSTITGNGFLEKNNTGYWLARLDTLYRLDLSGNIRWQKGINLPNQGNFWKLTKVGQDSLLAAILIAGPNTPTLITKYDSAGVEDWSTPVDLTVMHMMEHSSGNYVLSGIHQTRYKVMVMSPEGDSLWSRTINFNKFISLYKTIEISDGRIVTLAEETTFQNPGLARIIVVVDSLFDNSKPNSIRKLAPNLAAQCYPNPTQGQVQIDIQENSPQEYQVQLVSLLGQRVLTQSFAAPSFSLGVEQLPKGLYILTITSSSGAVFEQKLVVGE